jgi:hypothetical protein
MWTYVTLDGEVLDLTGLDDEERAFLAGCVAAYRAGMSWEGFTYLAEGNVNPLVRAADGKITRAVYHHPVYQAARDMEDRLGIAQGYVGTDPDSDADRDPFGDEWLPAAAAATRAGVTLTGLHKAIGRGEVVARPAKPGGTRLVVSANSLARWTPSPARQAAGRKRAAARAAGATDGGAAVADNTHRARTPAQVTRGFA